MLKQTLKLLNKTATFLFINAKAKARLISSEERGLLLLQHREKVRFAKEIYDLQVRRYLLGLGFFLSFIPGTEAYSARRDLYDSLLSKKKAGLFEFLRPMLDWFNNSMEGQDNMSLRERIGETIFRLGDKPWINPLNPFQYLWILIFYLGGKFEDFMRFFAYRPLADAVLFALLIPSAYITGALTLLTELLFTTIDTLIFDPIRFVCEEIKQAYEFSDKEFSYLPNKEAGLVVTIAKALNEPDKTYFHSFTNKNTLRVLTKEAKKQETVHLNSLFFKKYKNEPERLHFKGKKTIAKTYNAYTNSQHFFVFNAAQEALPKEIGDLIIKTCLDEKFIDKNQRLSKMTRL